MLKTKSNKSIIRIFLYSMIFISLISTAIIGYLWISHEFRRFEEDSEKMKTEYIESQKLLVKNEVQRVFDYIRYMRSKTDQRLKELLKERVYEAHSIAATIYKKYRDQKSEREIKRLIKDTLRHIRFNKGRGYFFIYRLNGILELYPVKSNIEGENHWNLQDRQGEYVVRNEVAMVKKQGEGFLEYSWKESKGKTRMIPSKVSFVKYFKPFNWYIGSKEYREDFITDLQHELLERIGKIRFGTQGYIFVMDFDGTTLCNEDRPELVGKKVWAMDTPDGAETIRQGREAAQKPGGGFIRYTWFKRRDNVLIEKTSFVQGIKDWQWIISAGVYLDEIDQEIAEKRVELQKQVKSQVIKIIVIFFIIFIVVILITLLFSGKFRKAVGVFLSFFRKAAISHEKIDKDKLFAEEFKELADSANRMLEERQKIENSLRESEERLAFTFRSIAEGVITTDTEQKVVLINQSAEKLMGWRQEEVLGKPLEEIFQIIYEEIKETSDLLNIEADLTPLLISRDGTRRLISFSAAIIRDTKGKGMGSVIVFQDITEKKQMEEERQKAQKLESLGLLAGGIAHDFNNLLTGILGNINLAKILINPEDKMHNILEQAENASNKAKGLTQQLLTFASGGAPIKKIHDTADLIREVVSFTLRGSNVNCQFSLAQNLWPVEVDKGQLNQTFSNLIINALQAMPGGGTINVSACNLVPGKNIGLPLAERKYVKIAIKDHGTGIPAELLKKIFDPYFSTKPKGSGLGLTSAYSIIKKHEGYIHVESQPGKGSVFTVYIPASHAKPPKPASRKNQTHQEQETIRVGDRGRRILVMDDDRVVGDVAMKMLTHLGYQVEVAVDGCQTVELYKKSLQMNQPYVAVIMDLTIPGGMGGVEAIKKLLEIDPQVKAIVSSGYSNDPVMADFRQYGFRGFIKKPYMMKELKKILDQVLE